MSLLDRLMRREAPVAARAVLEPAGLELAIPAGATILDAALDAGVPLAHSCRTGSCGTCRVRVVEGRVQELADAGYVLTAEDLATGHVLACQTRARSDLRLFVNLQPDLAPAAPLQERGARVASLRPLAPGIVELRVDAGADYPYEPGRYALLRLPGVDRPRAYSFAQAPRGGPLVFHIRLRAGGAAAAWLARPDCTGSALRVSTPLGALRLPPPDVPLLLVAGGTGFAPVHALLEQAADAGEPRDAVLVLGARTREELYGLEAAQALAARWRGSLRVVPILAEPDAAWTGARGHPPAALDAALASPERAHVVVCGPPPMVDASVARLRELGLAPGRILADRFV